MKRTFILLAVVLLFAGALFADEAILIDFSTLAADILPNEDNINQQNRQTLMDFDRAAGGSFTPEQKQAMKTSLAITNWEVILASSSRFVENIALSYAKESDSKQFGKIMGVRIHFPVEPFNSWAIIKPPFDIPAYERLANIDDDGNIEYLEESNGATTATRFEAKAGDNGKPDLSQPAYGVVKNVGTIKSVAVNAYGLNFPHGLFVTLIDSQGIAKEIFMGYLRYDGWKELRWDNPAYIVEVRNRDLRLYPLYPTNTPYIKFGGFRVARDAAKDGGDFVGYFKDVKVIFDKAQPDVERDIDDEATWRIIETRETARQRFEMERFGQDQVLRYQEKQLQATENAFTPSATNQ